MPLWGSKIDTELQCPHVSNHYLTDYIVVLPDADLVEMDLIEDLTV